jgi:hypothetical protein
VQHDLLNGISRLGDRDLRDAASTRGARELLPSHAESFGADAEWWWADHTYHYLGAAAISNVAGDPDAILRIQESSARYFQRPDREHGSNGFFTDRYDPTLEAIRGWGLYQRVAKEAGSWRWETSLAARSPGFEINDLGFQTRTDFLGTSSAGTERRTPLSPGERGAQNRLIRRRSERA